MLPTARRSTASGMTLVELLVAMAILLVAVAGALSLYDATWKSFKQGESAAEQQQGLRIAFEKIGLDLQMAGFNFNPDGHTSRPDEQIEAAYDTAIVLRADFDGELAPGLAGDAFDVVSTSNDEVIAYVLAKPEGLNDDTLIFEADMGDTPRDGAVETIQVTNISLVQDDPPYTLYRLKFNTDLGAWGTGDFTRREILAENIGSMTFRYFDDQGNQINSAFNLATVSDDVGGAETEATERARIHRVEIDLLGLARDPRPSWVDASDPNPETRSFRKFRLASNIRPRNLGLAGVPDDGSPPPG